jgi:hypothetical protein
MCRKPTIVLIKPVKQAQMGKAGRDERAAAGKNRKYALGNDFAANRM